MINPVHFLLLILCLFFTNHVVAGQYQVAVVIDDIGYRASDAKALSLPDAVTFSFLPHTPYGKKLALVAQKKNSDVLLHIPMEATNGKKMGPGGLHSSMNERSVRDSLQRSFDEIPFAIGINNHMGSLLTKEHNHMLWTMKYLKENNRLFLDSRTTDDSLAAVVAKKIGIPTLSRQVFLDNHLSRNYISKQFNQLIAIAKKQGQAIAIAHPHPESVESLQQLLPLLAQHNITLVPLSQLLNEPNSHYAKRQITE